MRALLLSLLILPAAALGERPADYATGLPLIPGAGAALHRVELPLAVHAQARSDLADLRVFNADGERVPHALLHESAAPAITAAPVAVPWFPLRSATASGARALDVRVEQDGRLISLRQGPLPAAPEGGWLFDLSAQAMPVGALRLDWAGPASGFSSQARLEASDDLRHWRPLADGPLLDLRFGGQQLRQDRLAFDPARHRYLRLSASPALPPLTAAWVEPAPERAAPALAWIDVPGRPGPAPGEYLFDLGAHLVATRLDLRLPTPNTVAPLAWSVRERRDADWREVARSTAYRLQQGAGELASPPLDVGRQGGRYWRVRVDSRAGGLGGGLPVLRLGREPVQLVFVARGKGPFLLAFGRRDAAAAQLPLASLLPGYRPGQEAALPLARTGAAVALGGTAAPAPGQEDRPPPDWKRWLLWAVLLGAVAMLALMARTLLTHTRAPD